MRAVRDGEHKIVIDGDHLYLYNVRRDPGERTDLARSRPDLARALRLKLESWEAQVNAEAATRRQ
jgi:arylsulfatase A-like enzyme